MKKFLFGILGLLFAVPAVADTLPAGYTELEYIDNNGTAWLDLGMPIGTSDIVTFDLEWNTLGSVPFFGGYNSGGSFHSQSFVGTYTGDGSIKGFYANSSSMFQFAARKDTRYLIKWNGCGVNPTVNGVDFSGIGTCNNFTPSVNAYLFTRNEGGAPGSKDNLKMYRFKVERNGNLVRDFVPAKNSSGVVGMYDMVSGNFFTNAGTGEFIAGPVVNSCRNLANITENTITLGMYTASDGTVVTTDNFSFQSDFIPVSPNTTYTISANKGMTMICVVEYDAGGNFIRRNATATSSNASKLTFTTGANTAKVTIGANQSVNNLTAAQVLAANWQLELGSTATEYVPYCANAIKIATTAYNSARFSPVVTELNDTIATIRSVVTNTINQTKAIADLQATKQTRPDETCPAGKKCLLVEDNDGQPHWYEIIENAEVQ